MAIKQKRLYKPASALTVARSPAGEQRSIRAEKLKNPEDIPPFYIRGQLADSKDEYWVSLWLEKFEKRTGIGWDYQYEVNGGRTRKGGNVVDFLVFTPGRWTLLDPMGKPWHTGHREDRYQMQNVARQRNWNLIAWLTDQTPTREMTFSFLQTQFNM